MHPIGYGIGFAARKAPGEAFVWDNKTNRYGYNLFRGHFIAKNKGIIKTLIIGDYAVGYGQGLVLNSGFAIDKSCETIKISRTGNLGIKPNNSLSNIAFRGVASTIAWSKMETSFFYSIAKLDATLRENGKLGKRYVQSLKRNNYYRTKEDLNKYGVIKEQVIGGNITYKYSKSTEVGFNALMHRYSLPIEPNTTRGNPYRFSGNKNSNYSVFFVKHGKICIFLGKKAFLII